MARMARDKKEQCIKEILTQTIAVSLTWPGPIIDNHIAGVSGVLKLFQQRGGAPFDGSVMNDPMDRIREIDLASALRDEFVELVRGVDPSSQAIPSVSLINDGDADALGTFASKITEYPAWQESFSHHPVAIAKAGTGTAGAVIVNGRLFGLNEFGKLIIDLAADNSDNARKDADDRWPAGDANKFFSMRFLRASVEALGAFSSGVEGLDLEILLSDDDAKTRTLRFGTLELVRIADPNIEYTPALADSGKTLRYAWNVGFELREGNADGLLDETTRFELAREPSIQGLQIDVTKKLTLRQLLGKLGANRKARLRLHWLLEGAHSGELARLGERMGHCLADLVALLHDFYDIRTVIVAGGPVAGKYVGEKCFESMNRDLPAYLEDPFHLPGQPDGSRAICSVWRGEKDALESKLWTIHDQSSAGMLGAAVSALYQYFEDQKISELQALKQDPRSRHEMRFVTQDEIRRAQAAFEPRGLHPSKP